MMNVEDLINAVTKRLDSAFGEEYEIYAKKDVVQGLKEPCFFVAIVETRETRLNKHYYLRDIPISISYFPKQKGNNVELQNMGFRLLDEMEDVETVGGELLRGVDMTYTVIDSVLHFFVKYNLMLKAVPEDADKMQTLNQDISVSS